MTTRIRRLVLLPLLSSALWSPLTARAQIQGQARYESYAFTTFAGVSHGTADGDGTTARFFSPFAIAVDGAGNAYVADTNNNTVRKISPTGTVSTFAGSPGNAGYVDAAGADARFRRPRGIAVDANGNVFVMDTGNRAVRKITPDGVVSTIRGDSLFFPEGIDVDSAGNVYVTDSCRIRKITASGVATTLAGSDSCGSADGIGAAAQFQYPADVAVDVGGNVFVADRGNETIRRITPAGVVTTVAGRAGNSGAADGIGTDARFSSPYSVSTDAFGNVYVGDNGNSTVRRIAPDGSVTTFAGTAGSLGSNDGPAMTAQFYFLRGVATDAAGNVYVADTGNSTVRRISAGIVTTVAGNASPGSTDGTPGTANFDNPTAMASDAKGNIYVADTNNSTIRKVAPDGAVSTFAGSPGLLGSEDGVGSSARFRNPAGVAIDATGSIYVADTGNHTIRKITSDRVVTTIAGFPGSQGSADGTGDYARFRFPGGVAVDDGGNLFVTDTRNHTIRKITPAAVVTTFAGSPGLAGQQNGFGSAASFSSPRGITIASSGIMYVADTGSHVIRGITPDRNVTRLAGFFGAGAHWDGTGSTARFASPEGVAVDAAGNVYVADTQNFLIRKVTPEGVTSTLGGFGGFPNSPTEQHPGSRDGTGPASRFFSPRGVTVGADGALFIADSLNNSIRRGQLAPLSFTRALSRKIHTGNRTLDVDLALTGTPTVEPRTGGLAGNHTLVVDFSTNMSQAEATIVGGSAGLSAPASASGTAIVVNLASAADAQIVEIAISNATDSLGRTLPPFSVRLGLLLGDVNNDGSVNAGDALVARNRSGQQANTANLRSDLNLDGVTNSGDALIVRSRSGSTLP